MQKFFKAGKMYMILNHYQINALFSYANVKETLKYL